MCQNALLMDPSARQKRGNLIGKTKRGKGTKIMAVSERSGLPVAVHIDSASPAECKLVENTVKESLVELDGTFLIADKAYDSDPLDQFMEEEYGISIVSPHKKNRKKPATQDGRVLRRYIRRWKVERSFAWFHNFRRIVVRWERKAKNFLQFIHLAMIKLMLKRL